MPTYEYRCSAGHDFELVQRMSDAPVATCPVCGAAASRRISGGAGLIFKGSGFYITDYGKDGKGPRKEASSTPADAPATKSDSAAPTSTPAPAAKPASGSSDA